MRFAVGFLALVVGASALSAATRYVNPGDNLVTMLQTTAQGGDTVIINGGTYNVSSVYIHDRHFTAAAPLIVKKGTGTVNIGVIGPSGQRLRIENCSYIVFDGSDAMHFVGGGHTVFIRDSHHLILKDIKVHGSNSAAIKIFDNSTYIDFISSEVYDTGNAGEFGEGLYIGTGNYNSWGNSIPDATDHIWLEGNVFRDIAIGECVEVKGFSMHVTIKNNTIYNMTATNQDHAGIKVGPPSSVEDFTGPGSRNNTHRDVWVEGNTIYNMYESVTNSFNPGVGIRVSNWGAYVKNNVVHHCDTYGVYVWGWQGSGVVEGEFPPYIYNTDYSQGGNGQNFRVDGGMTYFTTNPGANPNLPQTWYSGAPQAPAAPSNLTATAASSSQIDLSWQDNSNNETAFRIQRKTGAGGTYADTSPATVGAGVQTFSNTGLAAGTTYFYRVRAENANGNSAWAPEASATTPSGSTTVTILSVLAESGWLRESTETSNVGNFASVNPADISVGDNLNKQQVRGLLSFDTSSLPDGATITSATLRLNRIGLEGNPFGSLGQCRVDIKNGTFGAAALVASDFEAAPTAANVAQMPDPGANQWASGALSATGRSNINKTGKTQVRVYFATDDNNDAAPDKVAWGAQAGVQPELVITYQ